MKTPSNQRQYQQAGAIDVIKTYWSVLKEHPYFLVTSFVAIIILQAANLAAPLFLKRLFDLLAKNAPTPEIVQALVVTLSLVVLMWLVDWLARRIDAGSGMRLVSKVMTKLYDKAFTYLMGHSHSFFADRFAGSLTHKVSKFVRSFEMLYGIFIDSFFPTFLFVVGVIGVLFLRNAWLGLAIFVWTCIFLWFQIWVSLKRQPIRAERAEAETRTTGALADAISNHDTIALFSGTIFEKGRFAGFVDVWRKTTIRAWLSDEWIWAVVGLFMMAIEAGLLYGAILLWEKGLVTIGDFVLIQAYLLVVFNRLVSINRELRRFYDAFADAGEMVYMLQMSHEIADIKNAPALSVSKAEIEFKEMEFYFDKNNPLFKDFNLKINSGEKISFVGSSGAGKSTLTRLIMRLYDVRGGEILIDGQNISKVAQDSLREKIAFVPQEPILFHRTLRENIRYGRRDATDEEIIEAAKKAHCHEFISTFTKGYDTYVGERGVKLSGGERQRVAIARAILKNAPILLLDEATSSLDSESEALIQDALSTLMQEKTVIVIAHRLSTIMKMDRIIVVSDGKIAAEGTHSELLTKEGLYQKLWSIQAGGFASLGEEEDEINPEEIAEEESDEIEEGDTR